METESPKWRDYWSSGIEVEFFNSSLRALFTKEKSEIKDSSYNFVCDVVVASICRFDKVHSIWASQVVNVEKSVSLS